ncbi:MAG: M3 family metallopeptidase, partial [Rikenellaceae bacterium]
DHSNDISLNEVLFNRVREVYENRVVLSGEDLRLTEKCYKGFVRSGASLQGDAKEHYRSISKELSNLTLQFEQNLLAATNNWSLHLTDSADLAGLPSFVVEMGEQSAKDMDKEGWVFTLHAPSYSAFVKYSSGADLRKKMWEAYGSRAFNDEFSNVDIIKKIVELRLERANILGFESHANFVLEERMAKSPDKVAEFLSDMNARVFDNAKQEVQQIYEYACQEFNYDEPQMQSWDFSYYSEKFKNAKFSLSSEMLKPYFELSSTEKGVFMLFERLYGIKFIENNSISKYHEEVKVFEVVDVNGDFLSLLYVDYFPRPSKNGGAWMTSYRDQKLGVRPLVSVVCNFTKPTESTPSLLTFDEFNTFLHEMGHAMHGIFANSKYASLSGTNVSWDFVELPSQIMENWAVEPEYLNLWAKHYQTGESIPSDLIDKIVASRNFLTCFSAVRQLSFGMVDMKWHTLTSWSDVDVQSFEREAASQTQIFQSIDTTCFSPSFGHIFAGGYSAGYYSYKWAEVLDADAFSLFKAKGIFNDAVAKSFRDNILSKGSTEEAMDLYVRFKGGDPSIDALIERMGMVK